MRITIDQLHRSTFEYVRLAAHELVEVEDGGRLIAVVQAPKQSSRGNAGGDFAEREARIRQMPLINADSTDMVSADRDGR